MRLLRTLGPLRILRVLVLQAQRRRATTFADIQGKDVTVEVGLGGVLQEAADIASRQLARMALVGEEDQATGPMGAALARPNRSGPGRPSGQGRAGEVEAPSWRQGVEGPWAPPGSNEGCVLGHILAVAGARTKLEFTLTAEKLSHQISGISAVPLLVRACPRVGGHGG